MTYFSIFNSILANWSGILLTDVPLYPCSHTSVLVLYLAKRLRSCKHSYTISDVIWYYANGFKEVFLSEEAHTNSTVGCLRKLSETQVCIVYTLVLRTMIYYIIGTVKLGVTLSSYIPKHKLCPVLPVCRSSLVIVSP